MDNNGNSPNDPLAMDHETNLTRILDELGSLCQQSISSGRLKDSKIKDLEAEVQRKCDEIASLKMRLEKIEKTKQKKDVVIKNLHQKIFDQDSQIINLNYSNRFHIQKFQAITAYLKTLEGSVEKRSDALDQWYDLFIQATNCFNKMKSTFESISNFDLQISEQMVSIKRKISEVDVVEVSSDSEEDGDNGQKVEGPQAKKSPVKITICRMLGSYSVKDSDSDSVSSEDDGP